MIGPGREPAVCDNEELVQEFEYACRGGDYEFAEGYKAEIIKRLSQSPMKDEELQEIYTEEQLQKHEMMLEDYPDVLPKYETIKKYISDIRLLKKRNDGLLSTLLEVEAAKMKALSTIEALTNDRDTARGLVEIHARAHNEMKEERKELRQEVQRLKVRIAELEDERGDYFDQP